MKPKPVNKLIAFLTSALLVYALYSCNFAQYSAKDDETPTRGKIKIGVDESFTLLSEAELYTFQSFYTNATITPLYKPELDVLNDFMNDSVRMMITARKLTNEEEQYLKNKQIIARTTVIAFDGIAFIVNLKNKDSLIRFNTVKDIFFGKVKTWDQINTLNKSGKIKVVFDNNKSANVRFIREKFGIKDSFPKNCYAVNKNEEVVNFVEKNINAIGIVSVNWICDKNDSVTRGFLKRIKVVAISSEFNSEGDDFYGPYQAYIYDKSYPFIREVYAINRETFTGLGSGFIQFISGEQGQRIVLKMRMVPSTMPVRLVKVKNS